VINKDTAPGLYNENLIGVRSLCLDHHLNRLTITAYERH
jgi:hypothetical protein